MSRSATWFAPGRVNLIGDHTDYQLGWVLPFAVADGLTVTVNLTDTSTLDVTSRHFGHASRGLGDLGAGPRGWSAYVDGAIHLLIARGVPIGGAHVVVAGSLPPGGGVASSAALTCAVIAAGTEAAGGDVDATAVALMAQLVENDYVGAGVGYLDPAAVMFGRARHALVIDTRSRAVEPVPLDVRADDVSLLLVDTGQRHSTSGEEYAERVAQCERAAADLSVASLRDVPDIDTVERIGDEVVRARARHVVTENRRVCAVADLLRSGRLRDIGSLLVASHESLRNDFEASTPQLDSVVDTAMRHGALGARVTGAGFGGSAVVLVDVDRAGSVSAAVTEAFARQAWSIPTIRQVTPSAGARSAIEASPAQ